MFGTGGGLFGNNQQANTGGSIFGAPANTFGQPNNNQGGGLFGGAGTGQQPAQNNMFNNAGNAGGGGGLFGGANTGLGGNTGGGGLFGGGAQNNNQAGGGLFGGGGQNQNALGGGGLFGNPQNTQSGGGLFGGAQNPTQPTPFSLNGPAPQQQGGGGLFGGNTANTGGGLFGGGGNNTMLNQNNNMGNQAAGGLFGGGAANNGGGGLFGGGMGANTGMNNNAGGGGLFGMNNTSTNTFGAQNTGGGGLFGGNQAGGILGGGLNNGGGLMNQGTTQGGGLLGGGFSMGNNNGGLLGNMGNTNSTFGGALGSFGTNTGNAAQFQAKPTANTSLSSKPTEKNLCYSISNGQDFCIIECALMQRKMIKSGQLKPGVQGGGMMFGQSTGGMAQTAGGGLFGGQTNTGLGGGLAGNTGLGGQTTLGQPSLGGGLFGGAAQTQTGGGLFGGQTAANNAGGGLFGAKPTAPVGGGLFGASQPQAGGGLFGGGAATTTTGGGLFGGQTTQPPAGGGLFGGVAATAGGVTQTTTGGLFGGQTNPQPLNLNLGGGGGGLFGGQTNQQPLNLAGGGGGLFGNTGQPVGGGLLGAAPQTGGLFGGGATTQTGGIFGGQPTNTQTGGLFGGGAASTQTGGLFGQPANISAPQGGMFSANTNAFGVDPNYAGHSSGAVGGFSTLISLLEQSNQEKKHKSILDDDAEQNWVYGKSRDGQPGSLGYYQGGDLDNQSQSNYSLSEHQSLYGYKQKKQAYNQFKSQALRDEKEKKDELKKILNSFSSSFSGIGSEIKKKGELPNQSYQYSMAAAPVMHGMQRVSSSSSQSSHVSEQKKFIDQIDQCIYFIKSGTNYRIKIPVKSRYTYGDVKNNILNNHLNGITEENIRNFRLQARLKGPNKGLKLLRDNESIFNSKNVQFENIDYVELVEKSEQTSLNVTNNNNNSFNFNNNSIQNDDINDRSSIQNRVNNKNLNVLNQATSIKIPNGFSCYPTVEELEQFTKQQLMNVEHFVIENQFAKIVFQEPVNLFNIDLSNLEFGDAKISFENVPDCDRLNKPCIIEFKQFGLKQLKSKSKQEVKNLVDKLVKRRNLDLIKPYDVDNTKLVYRQENFDQVF